MREMYHSTVITVSCEHAWEFDDIKTAKNFVIFLMNQKRELNFSDCEFKIYYNENLDCCPDTYDINIKRKYCPTNPTSAKNCVARFNQWCQELEEKFKAQLGME